MNEKEMKAMSTPNFAKQLAKEENKGKAKRMDAREECLKDGVDDLCLFLDLFGDTPLLDEHERKLIPELIGRAEAFAQGVVYERNRKG